MSGHARSVYTDADAAADPAFMRVISPSRSPPPSQLSPLCWKIGHARVATNAIIVTITTPTSSDTAPSMRSARWSGQGLLRRSSTCVPPPQMPARPPLAGDRDPLAGDDLLRGRRAVD